MKIKSISSLAIGVAVGYGLSTPTGRRLLTRIKTVGADLLGRPATQQKVSDVAAAARAKTDNLPGPVTKIADAAVDAAENAAKSAADDGPATTGV